MRACIHRGSKQIGGNCIELESYGQRLIIDFGLPLDTQENHEQYVPSIKGLDGNDPSLLGILISHCHLDHFGLLPFISQQIPVGMGAAARRIAKAAAPFFFHNPVIPAKGWDYKNGESFKIGHFTVTPFLVDHSAYDAYSLLIESERKRIFYSGDLRSHGRKASLFKGLLANPPEKIDTLLLEGTSMGYLSEDEYCPTEKEIEEQLIRVFAATDGLVLVHASAQNIDRIVSIFKASKKTGRKMIIDLYTAAILEATGNNRLPQSNWSDIALYVPQTQRVRIKENAMFDLLNRHSVNRIFIEHLQQEYKKSILLFRPLHRFDLERWGCLSGAAYVYSQWEGYWEMGDYDKVKSWLESHSIPKYSIHTSGHASIGELKKLVSAINPNKVVPIHSFFPERYAELFVNVEAHNDGEWWEV